MLKWSDPQNKMRSGSVDFVDTCRRGHSAPYLALVRNNMMKGGLESSCRMTGLLARALHSKEFENRRWKSSWNKVR